MKELWASKVAELTEHLEQVQPGDERWRGAIKKRLQDAKESAQNDPTVQLSEARLDEFRILLIEAFSGRNEPVFKYTVAVLDWEKW